ncbi:hypothetical protein SAMN02745857_01332 [Andreprevotia lacus DSM 23236]|jgi:putative ubiquitin-RnfH superfamily antitoxin RatB of RatAB toxin-antitoxin module|uniref:UPF0125 protein SAMN02745857_01332 n=1 Tax=Andreprevotia lacus DSM 23236 TaxID=1121001 RepID=A0A1W1XEB5_9NEIS|nr:RnfH family protein [Andreprevotia lacus]SMC22124.1 hypothetical protein SAMN02745857_01332 [Andreprevotia lacus DSM 23236]
MADDQIRVEVAYATPARQWLLPLTLPAGSTAEQALQASGLFELVPALQGTALRIGIFGKACKHDATLRDGDRVEVYRPLLADPKEVRRQRVAEGRTMGAGRDEQT